MSKALAMLEVFCSQVPPLPCSEDLPSPHPLRQGHITDSNLAAKIGPNPALPQRTGQINLSLPRPPAPRSFFVPIATSHPLPPYPSRNSSPATSSTLQNLPSAAAPLPIPGSNQQLPSYDGYMAPSLRGQVARPGELPIWISREE